MNMRLEKAYISILVIAFAGCVSVPKESIVEPNQSVSKHQNRITKAILENNLELADKQYLALRGEHEKSKLISELILKLCEAHIDADEYLLARYYSDAYINDYPSNSKVAYAEFLKIKATFLRFKNSSSGQSLVGQLIQESQFFLDNYSSSKYLAELKAMMIEFHQIRKSRNEQIALSYERIGKPKAAEYYRAKNID